MDYTKSKKSLNKGMSTLNIEESAPEPKKVKVKPKILTTQVNTKCMRITRSEKRGNAVFLIKQEKKC